MSIIRDRLHAGQPCLGAWLGIPHPLSAEAMASLGFSWLAVDMEHGAASVDQAIACFMVAERHGCVPFARLPSADPYLARRLLDGGAAGLIIPVVEDAEAFAAFASHCLYPPAGRRGVGLHRANGWGDRFAAYLTGPAPVLVPQIETRKGVAAAEAIAALPMVDAIFLGPYDLSADLGHPGDFQAPAYVEAIAQTRAACAKAGKPTGIHQVPPDAEALARVLEDGHLFVACATDVIAMRAALAPLAALVAGGKPG